MRFFTTVCVAGGLFGGEKHLGEMVTRPQAAFNPTLSDSVCGVVSDKPIFFSERIILSYNGLSPAEEP